MTSFCHLPAGIFLRAENGRMTTNFIISAIIGGVVSWLVGLIVGPIFKGWLEPATDVLKSAAGDVAKSLYRTSATVSQSTTPSQVALSPEAVALLRHVQGLIRQANGMFLASLAIGIVVAMWVLGSDSFATCAREANYEVRALFRCADSQLGQWAVYSVIIAFVAVIVTAQHALMMRTELPRAKRQLGIAN
jgi:hypothetical protein